MSNQSYLSKPDKYFISLIIFSLHSGILRKQRNVVREIPAVLPLPQNVMAGPFNILLVNETAMKNPF